jgi:hypothetical protein
MATNIVSGNVVTIVLNVGYDYTGYDEIAYKFRKPDGTEVEKKSGDGVAEYGAGSSTFKLTYTVAEDELDDVGPWKVHPIVYQTATEADPLHGVPAATFNVVSEFDG